MAEATKSPREIAESKGEVSSNERKASPKYCGVCGLPADHPQDNCSQYKERGGPGATVAEASLPKQDLPAKNLKGG